MEIRSSPFIVGLFTIAVLFGAFGFIYWVGAFGQSAGSVRYRVVFSDEVTGLTKGSSVLYNGIKAGDVVDLTVAADDPAQVVALIQIDPKYPVNVDTTAQLQFTGITGVGFVQLKTAKADAKPLTEAWGDSDEPPIIYAEKSTFQDLIEGAQSLMTKIDTVVSRVDTLIATNETAVSNTIHNIETFSGALADNSDKISTFLSDASDAARSLSQVGPKVDTLATNLNKVVEAIDPEQVRSIVSDARDAVANLNAVAGRVDSLISENQESVTASVRNIETFSGALAENSDKITTFMADASSAAQRINEAGERIQSLADHVNSLVEVVKPDTVRAIVGDIRTFADALAANSDSVTVLAENAGQAAERINNIAARLEVMAGDVQKVVEAVSPEAIQRTVDNFDRITTTIASKDKEISQFIDDASATAAEFKQVGARLDGLLEKVDGMVGGEGTGNMIQNINEAAVSFRKLAENLNSRLDTITAGVERYGVGGLKDFQAFMSEGRRTLSNIDRAITNLESNPAGFLSGQSNVPEYRPGRRF